MAYLLPRVANGWGDLFQIAAPDTLSNVAKPESSMNHEVSLSFAADVRAATLQARIQRILTITAIYYGLAPVTSATGITAEVQV